MTPSRSEFVVSRGVRLHVRRWGEASAPLVFLLHGWMDVSASFQFLVDELGGEFQFLAPDWRGFGESDWLGRPYWFADYLADLDCLLGHYSPDVPASIVGHSMGGIIACLYAGIAPQRVRRLANLEGFGIAPTEPAMAPERYRRWLVECGQPPEMRRYPDRQRFAARMRRDNPRLSVERAEFLAQHLAKAEGDGYVWAGDPYHRVVNPVLYRLEEAKACWREISAPVLWVTGEASLLLREFDARPGDMESRQACFATRRDAVIADAGHMLQHDQPEALARVLRPFLRGD
jgi:pimeloyl-ACP methyl ester carboxylesterase